METPKKSSIVFLVLSVISSISTSAIAQADQFVGTYIDCEKNCLEYTHLTVYQTERFELSLFCDVGGVTTVSGGWFSKGDSIFLTTDGSPQPEWTIETDTNVVADTSWVFVGVESEEGVEAFPLAELLINDTLFGLTNFDGYCSWSVESIGKVELNAVVIDSTTVKIPDPGQAVRLIGSDVFPHRTACSQEYSFQKKLLYRTEHGLSNVSAKSPAWLFKGNN